MWFTKSKLNYAIIFAVFLITSCEEIIEFDTENDGGDLVVFGRFTNQLENNVVSVGITAPFDGPVIPIRFAEVVVKDENGNREIYAETSEEGVYKPRSLTLPITPGEKYFLEVCTPNGRMYRSELQTMPSDSGQDSTYFDLEEESFITSRGQEINQLMVKILLDSDIDRSTIQQPFYRWDVEEVYSFQEAQLPLSKFPFWTWKTCYITNPVDAQRFFLFDGTRLNNDNIRGLEIASRPADGTFLTRHYFNVFRYSLNFESFDYWRKVSQLTERVGSVFDNPPARLPSNILNVENSDEVVFGFFEVSAVSTSRVLVSRNDIPFLIEAPCAIPPEVNTIPVGCFNCLRGLIEEECLNCLILKNSSTVRPDYF